MILKNISLKLFTVFAIASSALMGCASKGFNRGSLNEQLGVGVPNYDNKEIEESFAKKGNLPKKIKLGVYFKPPERDYKSDWRWTEQDKALLADIAADLIKRGIATDVFPIIDSLVPDRNLKSLRGVAAKHQADAVLVISGAAEVDRYNNSWALTYIAIAPMLFVPGNEVETLFVANAALWDVRNEFLYMTAESEATIKRSYTPPFGTTDKELVALTKTEAVSKLNGEIKKMFAGDKL
jgi:hypothetical protein